LEEELSDKLIAASIIAYSLFLFLPLLCQLIGLNIFIDATALMIFMLIPMSLTAIVSGVLAGSPKSSPAPPIIGGLAALLTAYLLFIFLPDLLSDIFNQIYYTIQYFISVFGSGAMALFFSFLKKSEEQRELMREMEEEGEPVKTVAESNTLKCPYCGREIPADSIFCPLCGRKIGEEAET